MAAFTLRLCAIVEVQAGVVAYACMAEGAGLQAIGVHRLCIRMAQPAGLPVDWHVGDIGHGVQVI